MPFDEQDKAVLRALDGDFTIRTDGNGDTATLAGEMKIEMCRPAFDGGSQFWITITLPGGDELSMTMRRDDLKEQNT